MIRTLKIAFLTLMVSVVFAMAQTIPASQQAGAMNECGPKMSEGACDSKIQRDLAAAIRNNAKGCQFEPGWRPTHYSPERTVHVSEVDRATFTIKLDRNSYTLQAGDYRNSACQGDCSRWKPEVGKDYPATVTDKPKYLNSCLQRVLPAKRDVCIGFGKVKQETLPYGVFRKPEFDVCYSVSVTPVELSAEQVQATTTTTPAPAQASAREPAAVLPSNDNYYTNSEGNRVHSPAYSPGGVPAGATAVCRDGTYSFSHHRQGTCSHHGGVANWL